MHAYLLISSDSIESDKQVKKLANKSQLLKFEILKIEGVRDLIKTTSLKVSGKTSIYIPNIDNASIDAQNALLKSLEEPQENLIYILTARSQEALLPTIVSRCEVINLQFTMNNPLRGNNLQSKTKQAQEFMKMSVGKKLALTSKIKTREAAVEFIKEIIMSGHELMIKNPDKYILIDNAQKTLNALSANGNIQLQLTNFVVKI